ncbi:cytochrome c3 family protein [Benzoatithermus flavus]|uniref:Cytochrome c3 family protein n=1 Tax=Benzoatithermus flavus TaxID=3108223 RepID=A0ABU8XRV4_9PROT
MAQIFHPGADTRLRLAMVALGGGLVLLFVAGDRFFGSDWFTGRGDHPAQPVPFSHQHHVAGLGIDCRYCHDQVERTATAGYPPTYTCMSCHSQIWTGAPVLAPVRASLAHDEPIRWQKVYDLPDFVYFDHAIHLKGGVGCSTCHGRVDRMPITAQAAPLTMGWCLSCHRDPAPHLRDPADLFAMDWQPGPDQRQKGEARMARLGIEPARLQNCYTCHR